MVYTVDGVNYTRRTKIFVTGAGSGAQTDFQIKLTALWKKAMQADYDDVRFTKADMQTLIDAWLESKTDSTTADIWAEFPDTPADGVEETGAYMYFGNGAVASDWDIGATFLVGDDFTGDDDDPIDSAKWDTYLTIGATAKILSNKAYVKIPADDSLGSMESKNSDIWAVKYLFRGVSSSQLYAFNSIGIGHSSSNNIHDDGYFIHYRYNWGGSWTKLYKCISGATTEIDSTASHFVINTDYVCEWVITPSKVEFIVDDVVWLDSTNTVSFAGGKWEETVHQYNTTGGTYIDRMYGRKNVANPPTAAFGTEEHQRRTPMMM